MSGIRHTMTDEELANEWQRVEDAMNKTKDGFFNSQCFQDTLQHSRAKGAALIVHLALASLADSNRQATLTDREVHDRSSAIHAYFHLEYRVGRKRLDQFLLGSMGLQRIEV